MESLPQSHFSPSSARYQTDLTDCDINKLQARLASHLLTPPKKRQNPEDDSKTTKENKLAASPIPPSATSMITEFQPDQQEQVQEKIPQKMEEEPKTAKCRYCDESKPVEQLRSHQDNCDKRTIDCEACGEKVELDIFDFHMEMCPARIDAYEAMYHAAQQEFLASLAQQGGQNINQQEFQADDQEPMDENIENEGNLEPQEGQEEGHEGHNSEPYDDDDDESGDFDPDAFTYEQLLTLDNTIVKKGLTQEEMKKFPVKVYLKNLDGPISCSVCISDCESGEILRDLSCGHKFHKDCVDTWLENNITCPVCKKYFR